MAKDNVLSLTDKVDKKTVRDVLPEKHPEQCKANLNYLVSNEYPKSLLYHQFIFAKLNASIVRKSAMKAHGSHGNSGLDANEWQRLLTSFKSSSTDLFKEIAKLLIRIATSHLIFLLPYNSCRLIVPDKCPGVQTSFLHYQNLLHYQVLYNCQLFHLRLGQKTAVLFEKEVLV